MSRLTAGWLAALVRSASMTGSGVSFKTGGRKNLRANRRKGIATPKKFTLDEVRNANITVLPTPIKSESDKKSYRVIRLENGLTALLVSDPQSAPSSDSDSSSSGSEYESSSDEESGSDEESEVPAKNSTEHEDKAAACALCIGVGSYSDPPKIQGMAHFVEHMVFMGSKKYPVENAFDAFIRKKGGSDNAQTDCEDTTFYFEIQETHLAEGLDRFVQFFVSPLMKQEAMQREKESIESEFALATPNDSNRREQLLCMTLPVGHPSRTFMWGNCRSLTPPHGPVDSELYKQAHIFRERHYSAHRMTVAVQARLPLDTLQKYVISTFGHIPSNNIPADDFSSFDFSPATITPEFHSFYYVKPLMQTTSLTLTWCMRSFMKEYESKPHHYVAWIIGHEGTGSLLLYLQRKVWALGVYSGITDGGTEHTSILSLFNITLILTDEGLKNIDKVLDAVFGYINMLKKSGPSERIFKEIQKIEEVNFRFKDEPQPYDHVEQLAENMQHFPPEHYMTAPDMYFKYDPDAIMYVINSLTPETVNIMLLSQNHPEPIQYDAVEEWFSVDYKRTDIPEESVLRWKNIIPEEYFHLPEPNIFIPDDFNLIAPLVKLNTNMDGNSDPTYTVVANTSSHPALIKYDDFMEVWFKPDYKFELPYTFVYVYFITPITIESAKAACLLDLWCLALNQLLTEKLYAADVTGITRSIVTDDVGIMLKLHGFSQKMHNIIDEITLMFKNYKEKLNEDLFNALKEIQTKAYTNTVMKPNKLVREIRLSIITETFWPTLEKLKNLKLVTFEDIQGLGEKFTEKLYVKMLMQGNIVKDDALNIANTIKNNLQWSEIQFDEKPKTLIFEIPLGENHCRISSFNKDDENSIISNYYQYGVGNINSCCIVELITLIMEEPLFDTLRTKEQLGYNVFCTMRYTSGVLGFSVTVTVQAGKYCTGYVDQRIEEFLKEFLESVKNMSEDSFEQSRTALIKIKNAVDVELKDEISRNWDEIVINDYQFNKLQMDIECLKSLTLKDVKEWLDSNMKNGSKENFRKLSIQIAGHGTKAGEVSKHVEKKVKWGEKLFVDLKECNYSIKYLDDESASHFIRDIDKFKNSLIKYPEKLNAVLEIAES